MSMFIKICGLRDATSVGAVVEAGANAVGFVFAESVRKISPEKAHEVAQDVPGDVLRVAVMRHPLNEQWQSVRRVFAPDVLQTDIEDFGSLDVPDNIVCWPVIRQGSTAAVGELPDTFVYEGPNSGTGEAVDWAQARKMAEQGQMILAGGLAAGNVATAIRAACPWGVDVSSGVESSPGQKDVELIRQFIAAVRAAENDG